MNPTLPVPEAPAVPAEDAARVRWYTLLAGLFRAPPSQAWLDGIGASAASAGVPVDDSALGHAWQDFALACAQANADAVRDEYDAVFVGVGKTEVLPYASYYLSGFLNERPLVELREHLALLGLARRAGIGETEDHVSALCETMAWLIAGDGEMRRDIATQRAFFTRFIGSWYDGFAAAIEHCGLTDFYKHAGRLLRAFLAIEQQAFTFDSLE